MPPLPGAIRLTWKPSFLAEILALSATDARQVVGALEKLAAGPVPEAAGARKIHRTRAGACDVLYTSQRSSVSILGVRRCEDKVEDGVSIAPRVPAWSREIDAPEKPEKTPLPAPITPDLLRRLRVPKVHHARLLALTTEDDLLNCPGVPDEILQRIDQALVARPIDELLAQPDLAGRDAADLLRYKEGDLLGFLLELDAELEKYVGFRIDAQGPTLLKGGTGTGKSTVALYRTREMIAALRAAGARRPRILFATYTNALVAFSRQLLEAILGEDAALVDVRTADSLAMAIAAEGRTLAIAGPDEARGLAAEAAEGAAFSGNLLQRKAQAQTIDRLGVAYVLDEIREIIEARRLPTLAAYQAAARPGREAALNKIQREAVWRVREALVARLAARDLWLWEQVRARAATRVEEGQHADRYDAVLVDEAQDLQPVAIQMLVALCRAPNRLFFTADANQSIYGGGFRWPDVHEALRFTGRTGVLKANYRSTREIGEAANGYLANGEIDGERDRAYIHHGPTPAVRAPADVDQEARLLSRFVRAASKDLRVGLGAAAVLAPTEKAAQRIAEALRAHDVPARYMTGKTLDLAAKEVKVLTLRSAKGLEFPAVALAGFLDGPYPPLPPDATEEEATEITVRERRTMFVAMTRAMRALLVVVPRRTTSPLLQGFEPPTWNTGG